MSRFSGGGNARRLSRALHTFYEIRARKDHRGVDLISDALPFGRLWYDGPNAVGNAMGYAEHYSPLTRCCDSRLR